MVEYTGVPESEIEEHVKAVAKKGWDKLAYPCFGMLWFLHFDLAQSPVYAEIVRRVRSGSLLLDLGCGLGQDIRRLVYDGAPARNIVGLDLHWESIELGFELFRDRDRAGMGKCAFLVQDFFDQSKDQGLEKWTGCFGVVNSGYLMHLWDWDGQVEVGVRVVGFLALRERESCIVTGVHFGSKHTGRWEKVPAGNEPMYLHDSASLAELWGVVGEKTGTGVQVWSVMEQDEDHVRLDPNGHRLRRYVRVSRRAEED